MYDRVVTVYNREPGGAWLPTVLRGVDVAAGEAALARRYGAVPDGEALLGVATVGEWQDGLAVRGTDKLWLPPKRWRDSDPEARRRTFTFTPGEGGDFFAVGDCGEDEVSDADEKFGGEGFYAFCRRTRDGVYAIRAVSRFYLIPHFEVTGR